MIPEPRHPRPSRSQQTLDTKEVLRLVHLRFQDVHGISVVRGLVRTKKGVLGRHHAWGPYRTDGWVSPVFVPQTITAGEREGVRDEGQSGVWDRRGKGGQTGVTMGS